MACGPARKPYRIDFVGIGPVSDQALQEHIAAALASGFPLVERRPLRLTQLAVVGGGPSLKGQLEELRAWNGEIWAINQTATYLTAHGIPCTLFAIDPGEDLAQWTTGIPRAYLASICHPALYAKLRGRDVRIFHTEHYAPAEWIVGGGCSAATRAPFLALHMGYASVTFFGCEGSFETTSHVYRDENTAQERPKQLLIRAGALYRTGPDYLVTSQNLAQLIRQFPQYLFERSGGLLRALLDHWESWEIVALSQALKDELDPTALPYVYDSK